MENPLQTRKDANSIFWKIVGLIALVILIMIIAAWFGAPDQSDTRNLPPLPTSMVIHDALVASNEDYNLSNQEINVLTNYMAIAIDGTTEGYEVFYDIKDGIYYENGSWTIYLEIPYDSIRIRMYANADAEWRVSKLVWPKRYQYNG